MDYKAAYKRILKTHITPLAVAAGFANKGAQYRRVTGAGVIQHFSFEGSRFNSPDSFSFTGNLSFQRLTPVLATEENQRTWLDDDPDAWLFGARLGYLTHGMDHWYAMERSAEEDLIAELTATVSGLVLPLMARCVDVETVLALKEAVAPEGYAAQTKERWRQFVLTGGGGR